MIVISEKIAPPRRSQIFNDYPAQDAIIKKSLNDEDRWVKQFIDNLAGLVRKIGKGK
jgi:hypothetical protein